MDENEAKYEDYVKILRTYEDWIFELYKKAGVVQQREAPQNPDLPYTSSAPDKPNAHYHTTNSDTMRNIKVPFGGGDQLTRVRFAGATDLLAGTHTPTDRLEHCSPFRPVM